MKILEVKNLTKYYGSDDSLVKAVDNVSFRVNKGDFVAIVGPSGGGKSTLLHLLGGLDKPDSGSVFIDGEDIYDLKEDKLTIFKYKDRSSTFIKELSNSKPIDEDIVESKPANTYSASQATSYLQRMKKSGK